MYFLSKQNSKILIKTKVNQKKILEITQKYSQTAFTETEPCLGYEIDVWQESINQTFCLNTRANDIFE